MALLSQAGIQVVLAVNGQDALDKLGADPHFDGVLMDCQMPVMDGYTATREIRKNPAFNDLPIIAMTANAMSGDRDKVLQAGMCDHIAKPLDVAGMFATLAKWIKPRQASSPAPATSSNNATPKIAVSAYPISATGINDTKESATLPNAPTALPELPGIDVRAGLATTMNNAKLYTRLLLKFRDTQGQFAELFAAALKDPDSAAPARAAHTLKGTAGNIGAKQVQAAAGELEHSCQNQAAESEVQLLLQAVLAELAPVLKGLQVFCSVLPVPLETAADSMPQARPAEADLDRLEHLLRESDGDAEDAMNDILEQPMSPALAKALKKAAAALEQFDFEAALAALLTARQLP